MRGTTGKSRVLRKVTSTGPSGRSSLNGTNKWIFIYALFFYNFTIFFANKPALICFFIFCIFLEHIVISFVHYFKYLVYVIVIPVLARGGFCDLYFHVIGFASICGKYCSYSLSN